MNRTRILELLSQAAGEPQPPEEGLDEAHWKVLEHFVELVQQESSQYPHPVSKAAFDVQSERQRQIECEGWTPDHDDEVNDRGQLAAAAACYAINAAAIRGSPPPRLDTTEHLWPWDAAWFKCTTPRRDLVKAGALIQAAIEWEDRNQALEAALSVIANG